MKDYYHSSSACAMSILTAQLEGVDSFKLILLQPDVLM